MLQVIFAMQSEQGLMAWCLDYIGCITFIISSLQKFIEMWVLKRHLTSINEIECLEQNITYVKLGLAK